MDADLTQEELDYVVAGTSPISLGDEHELRRLEIAAKMRDRHLKGTTKKRTDAPIENRTRCDRRWGKERYK